MSSTKSHYIFATIVECPPKNDIASPSNTTTKESEPAKQSTVLSIFIISATLWSCRRSGATILFCISTMLMEAPSVCSTETLRMPKASLTLIGSRRTCREILLPSIMKAEPRYTPISMMHGATARFPPSRARQRFRSGLSARLIPSGTG